MTLFVILPYTQMVNDSGGGCFWDGPFPTWHGESLCNGTLWGACWAGDCASGACQWEDANGETGEW